jgi:ABC-type branched-subunit amino acid transport system ATPase component
VTAALELADVSVRYGGVTALDGVSLTVPAGKLVGLIGPNGAGKTTCIDAVTGMTPCTGRVQLEGSDVSHLAPHARARMGLTRTWQSSDLFNDLTVNENLTVASSRPNLQRTLRQLVGVSSKPSGLVEESLSLLGIEGLAAAMPRQLSDGQRKLVGVARALTGRPHVICLDEPAAGLDTHESEELGQRLRRVVDAGRVSMLLVDHDMGLVMGICDEIVVLEFGRVIAQGPPDRVRSDARVIKAYLGGSTDAVAEVTGEVER